MIPLYLDHGVAYVWNSEDWFTLRTKHRVCGSLIGSLPSFPRQNDFTGLPMALLSEEAALLVEKEICCLFHLPKLADIPSEEQKNEAQSFEEQVQNQQIEALKKRRIEQMSHKIDMIMVGKRQKLLAKGITDINLDKQAMLQEEINKLQNVAPAHMLVHLPTENYLNTEQVNVTIEDLEPSIMDKIGSTRYKIFKDLWEKGHHITGGSKFGADFLVYPGDPVRFHAMYMVRCICDSNKTFSPKALVVFGRLSVAVNKLAVLACCDKSGAIKYQTLQWHDTVNG